MLIQQILNVRDNHKDNDTKHDINSKTIITTASASANGVIKTKIAITI